MSASVEQMVAEAVRGSLDADVAEVEPTGHGHNRSWFALADGEPVVVKTSPLVRFEGWAARRARERGAPTAEVLAIEPAESSPFADGHLISRRAPGTALSHEAPSPRRTELVRQAGAALRRIHEVEGTAFGAPRADLLQGTGEVRGVRPTWRESVESTVEQLLELVVPDRLDPSSAEEVGRMLACHGPLLDEQQRSTLVHGDFTHSHVLVLEEEPEISAIIDFDGGMFGAPAYDLAVWSITSPDVQELARGYEPDPVAREILLDQVPLYRLLRLVSQLRWGQIRDTDPAPGEEAVRRALRVARRGLPRSG